MCPVVSAQTKIDSLIEARLVANHDTTSVRIDIGLGMAFENTDFDSALFYYQRALQLSRSSSLKEFPRFEGLVLENMGFAYYLAKRDRDQLIKNLKMAMSIYQEEGLLEDLANAENNLATHYSNFSMYDSAVYHFDQIIERNLANGTDYHMATSYSSSGLNSYYLRHLDKAAERLLGAIRYSKSTGDTAKIYAPYLNYGLVLKEQGEYEKAKEYMRASQAKLKLIDHTRGIALTYTNIGQVLIKQDSLDGAFQSFTDAWSYQEKLGFSKVDYYNNGAWIEKQRGDYRKYHEYALEAVKTIPEGYAPSSTGDVLGTLVEAKLLLADSVYFDLTNEKNKLYREALPYAERGWHLADSVNAGNVKLGIAELLATVNSKIGRFEEAFKYSQIAKRLSEEINDQAKADAIARMTTEFETEKISGENALLQETQKRQTAQLKQQRYLIAGAMLVLILIVSISLIIQRNRLKLKKANARVEKSLEEKELLLKEIHHRVKNNLQVVSSLLDLQSRGIEDEGTLSTFMEGQNRVKAMALIHQKLYQNENLATINFEDYANVLIGELSTIYNKQSDVKTVVNGKGASDFDIDTAIPLGLILNELISNAYKYAFNGEEQGALSVSINSLGEGKHQLIVEDNGGGLPDSFDFQKAKSLGLRLVRRLAKQLYGNVEYSNIGGAKFVINFTDTLQRKAI